MKCPDCSGDMDAEDASAVNKGLDGKTRRIIATNYYCPHCVSYWRWDYGRKLSRAGTEMEQRAAEGDTSSILRRLIDGLLD